MRQRQKEDVQRILWFPLVFLIAWSGGLINRLYTTVHDESYELNILMYVTIPSMGWLNAIAYVTTHHNSPSLLTLHTHTHTHIHALGTP